MEFVVVLAYKQSMILTLSILTQTDVQIAGTSTPGYVKWKKNYDNSAYTPVLDSIHQHRISVLYARLSSKEWQGMANMRTIGAGKRFNAMCEKNT